jgi:acetyl-CoA synthetase
MQIPFRIKTLDEYKKVYAQSVAQPEEFWAGVAENFQWRRKWDKVLEWNFKEPDVKWFINAKLNITENCLDRHVETQPEAIAMIWEPNDPKEQQKKITYRELYMQVCRFAQVLQNNGVKKGDRVCIYMGMIPELPVALLACARIGAIHSVVFAGFSANSIVDRLQDAKAEYVITCDGANRGAKSIPLKPIVDEALEKCEFVKKIIVYERTKTPVTMQAGRDIWWSDEMAKVADVSSFPAAEMDAEDMLFILYTSGSTGKPKGVVHTCGGYMVYTAYSFANVFQYDKGDVFFCTADIGWVTGHSYIVYGPLSCGATTLLFEGVPTWPDAGRLWEIVDKYEVNILYTAPTAIRSLMALGTEPIEGKKLDSLKVLGTVGEPINEEAWHWYDEHIGKKRCPIVDTWWQTETGGVMISNLAGVTPAVPTQATLPLPGIQPILVDDKGQELTGDAVGNLCIKFPWPSMVRTTYGDHERCRQAYFSTYHDLYFTGDGCHRDEKGNYRITGRVDDVLNVSGHRIGTAEVEDAINMHDIVVESAVVGYPHDVKGQGIYAYVILDFHTDHDAATLRKEIAESVAKHIGAIAKPDKIQFVKGLPKTRSGKIMRRILRKIAEGELGNLGDTSTLLDPAVVDQIKEGKL